MAVDIVDTAYYPTFAMNSNKAHINLLADGKN